MAAAVDTVNSLVTLAQVRARLDLPPDETERDGVLVELINHVARWANSITDRNLKQRAYTNELIDACGGRELWLPNWPVDRTVTFSINADVNRAFTSATELTVWNESASPVTDDVILHDEEGLVEMIGTLAWPNGHKTVKLSYTAGVHVDDDSPLVEAVLELIDAMWCTAGEEMIASWSGGGITTSLLNDARSRVMPARVRSIFNGERRVTL